MKFLERIKGIFSRDKPQDSYRFSVFPFWFGKSTSGKFVTEFSAMQNTCVYCCVKVISESVASLPLHVYRQEDNGNRDLAIEHNLYPVLHDAPNDEMTSFVFREVTMTHLLLWGNAYSQILRNNRGQVIGLYPLLPNRMSVERDDDGTLYYLYTPVAGESAKFKQSTQIRLRREDILHVPALGFNGLVGFSPIAMARNAIGMSMACEDFGSNFFANGARPSGILKTATPIKDPKKLQDSWQSMYGGENAGRIAILEEGMTYEPISIPPSDAQFLSTRKFQIAEIARIFRVPLHFLNDLDKASFNNIEQQNIEYVTYTLTPWIARLEQSFNKALFSSKERGKYFVKFNLAGLLRGDYSSRVDGYSKLIQNGVLSVNDVRALEDMNMIPAEEGGDLHLINGAMSKLEDAGIFSKKKAGDKDDK